jgi:hypothetical protein
MQKMLRMPLLLALLSCLILTPLFSHADDAPTQTEAEQPVKVNVSTALPALQKRLDTLKQQVSAVKTDKKFTALNDDALKLAEDANKLAVILAPQLTQIQAQLDVLGPAPAPGTVTETAQVVGQRKQLNNSKTLLTTQIEQIKAIAVNAQNLSSQIYGLRRDALKTQIALNTGSILGEKFWSPLERRLVYRFWLLSAVSVGHRPVRAQSAGQTDELDLAALAAAGTFSPQLPGLFHDAEHHGDARHQHAAAVLYLHTFARHVSPGAGFCRSVS